MYFAELLCLHFFSIYMLQGCKKHNVTGERAGLASNYHRNKEKKCREMSGDLDEHVSAGTGKETKPQN